MLSTILGVSSQAYTYVKSQPWLRNTLIVLLVLAVGYGAGRYTTPTKVVVQDHVVTVTKEVVVTQVKTQIQYVKVKDTSLDHKTHETVTETTKPDGTKTEVTTIDTDTTKNQHVDTSANKSTQANSSDTKDSKTDSTHTQITTNDKEGWHLGVDLGLSLPHYLTGAPTIGIPSLNGAVIGVHAEHRVIGPLYIGLFANSQGTLGLSASGEF